MDDLALTTFISRLNDQAYAVTDNIYADLLTTIVLYIILVLLCKWLFSRDCKYLTATLISLTFLLTLYIIANARVSDQKKMIVYNIPKAQAIDLVFRNKYFFIGDTGLSKNTMLQNFHLKPARISLQLNESDSLKSVLSYHSNCWQFLNKKILIIDKAVSYVPSVQKTAIDVLILSKNARVKITDIVAAVSPAIIVFDTSNSLWKIANWKRECITLDLQCFSIPEQGAFILDIDQ